MSPSSNRCECGHQFHSHVAIVVKCPDCSASLQLEGAPLSPASKLKSPKPPTKPNLWVSIHSRYAAAMESGEWDQVAEQKWLDTEFNPSVPCASCKGGWLDLAKSFDLSTAESAFKSIWQAHNHISEFSVKPAKPTITYEQCKALYLQQPSMDDCCVAVTSLSPKRLERQTLCLNTWKRAGLTIYAVQGHDEVETIAKQYPQVNVIGCDNSGPPFINQIADVATQLQKTVLLINSDLELRGEQRLIREALAEGSMIGIRYNYPEQWWLSNIEPWGIDIFSFTPKTAASLPRLSLHIGRPMWDYWVPYHLKLIGEPIRWVKDPLFFHESHELNWTQDDWQAGCDVFTGHYEMSQDIDWAEYRRGLEL